MAVQHNNPFLENWLALSHVYGIGPSKFQNYLAEDPQLANLPAALRPDWTAVKRDLLWLQKTQQAHIITLNDPTYPFYLKQISNPPPILYVLGDVNILQQQQLAIVGSRAPSPHGRDLAKKFACELTQCGLTITSGLATGIDTASHIGALTVGKTIAVAAYGLDIVYPAVNQKLALEIVENGCLISEFAIGTPVIGPRFVQRNRIISGLSLGVLVIEAAIRSGSLSTARYAADQNREIFAVPGSIHSAKVKGCHQLIKAGAKLVESAEDVLEELANLLKCVIRDKKAAPARADTSMLDLTAPQALLLRNIEHEGTCFDDVVTRTELSASMVGAILAELELFGLIKAVPGGYARRLG